MRYDCFGNRNIQPVYHKEQNQNSHGEHRIVSINWNYVVLKYQYSDNIYIDAFFAIYTLYLTFASTQHCHQRLQRIYSRTVYACFHLLTKFYFLPERKLSRYLPLINDSIFFANERQIVWLMTVRSILKEYSALSDTQKLHRWLWYKSFGLWHYKRYWNFL